MDELLACVFTFIALGTWIFIVHRVLGIWFDASSNLVFGVAIVLAVTLWFVIMFGALYWTGRNGKK